MPKKLKNCFDKKLTFENFLQAHYRARKNKKFKNEIIIFELNLENNLVNLINSIKNGKYKIGKYHTFKIYEPKERIIESLPYRDRIVHQWYVEEFIKPYIVPRFIDSTFACIDDKGTHKAVNRVQKNMQEFQKKYGDFWILKCDIKKYFYNIDNNILYKILTKYISDKKLLNFTKIILFDSRKSENSIGIPIGNYTSQYFANIYLNELDQYIIRTLKNNTLVRYMDDFVLLCKTKNECKKLKEKIVAFLKENLKIELNEKSRYYPSKQGVNFCGYRIFLTHRLLRLNSKKKIKKNVKKWNKQHEQGTLDINHTLQSINSWVGHASHCNSYKLRQKILNSCKFLYTEDTIFDNEKDFFN